MNNRVPGKTKAVIAYLTFIGFFIAISMNREKPDAFSTWHIKNMFGLLLILFASLLFQFNELYLVGDVLYGIAFMLWAWSLAMALRNSERGVPILSKKFQTWFSFLG